jgi:hypothetical protein
MFVAKAMSAWLCAAAGTADVVAGVAGFLLLVESLVPQPARAAVAITARPNRLAARPVRVAGVFVLIPMGFLCV